MANKLQIRTGWLMLFNASGTQLLSWTSFNCDARLFSYDQQTILIRFLLYCNRKYDMNSPASDYDIIFYVLNNTYSNGNSTKKIS